MAKHTSGPYRISDIKPVQAGYQNNYYIERKDEDDCIFIAECDHLSNAEFVICACNSHADLLAVCEMVDEEWHLAHDEIKQGKTKNLFHRLCRWQDEARAALAKARKVGE